MRTGILARVSASCVVLFLAGACWAPTSRALGLSGAGGKVGYTNPENLDGTMMVGGHVELEERGSQFHVVPNLMYWKVDRVSDVNPNLDVYYHFQPQRKTSPYLGGGIGVDVRNSEITDRSETALNANVIGGFRFPNANNAYFVEGRYKASETSQVALVGGITFGR